MAQYNRIKPGRDGKWFPAIYARLSDDDGRAGVSLSIEHQIEILTDFVKSNGWESPKIFYEMKLPYLIQIKFEGAKPKTRRKPL